MIPRLSPSPRVPSLTATFCAELRARGFAGDLTMAEADRTALATDNSIYQITPQAIAFPRDRDDLVRIATLLAEERFATVRIAPRGGGTGTNGQSLTDGIVVDLSRHMNRILAIDPVRRTARVEAGVVKDQLNAALAEHGLFFAPELSTSNRATIGGMISTDACGQGSCLYGKTRDHVRTLTTVLADGTVWHSEPLDDDRLAAAQARQDLAGAIHREVDKLQRENAALIDKTFPPLNRCLTGYDLAHLRRADGRFDLNAVLCGSEGTLGLLAEATLNVLPLPSHVALVNLRYDSFDAALRDARTLVAFGAASVETVDSKVLGLAQEDPVWEGVTAYFPEDAGEQVQGVNLIEFVGDGADAVEAALTRLTATLDEAGTAHGRRGYTVARGEAEVGRLWAMRKKAVGLLGNTKGDRRPMAFVEDTAVPPEHLADYIAEFRAALDRRGLEYGMFGHVDAGVLHVRPAIDMKAPGAEALVRAVTEDVVALTQRYGGLLWGEHGKGVRSEFSPRFFGPLYPVLQAVKAAFDPRNQFNPGEIAAPEGAALLTVDGVPTKGQRDRTIPAHVRAGYDEALHCNGNGAWSGKFRALNTRFLSTLCAVADAGSLAGAARAMGLSSAAVAEQIQTLERGLGVRLITRLGRAVTLTDEGRAVVTAGRDILRRVADLTQVAQLGRLSGTLRIGSVSTALMSVVPPTLRHMAEHHPEIALKIVPGTSSQLLSMLEGGAIDCAITVRPTFEIAKEFGWHLIREEPLTLVCPAELPFEGVEACLSSSPMISMYRNSPTGRIAERFLQDKKIVAKELFEIEAAEVILVLVSQGLGVSLLPDYGFESSRERRIRKMAVGDRAYGRPVGILYRRGARISLIDAFHAAIKNGAIS